MNNLSHHIQELANRIKAEQRAIDLKENELRLAERDHAQKEQADEVSAKRVELIKSELKDHRKAFADAQSDLQQTTKEMSHTVNKAG